MKKVMLILFPEGNLPYSPTLLNLIDFTRELFEVHVLAEPFVKDSSLNTTGVNIRMLEVDQTRRRFERLANLRRRLTGQQDHLSFYEREKYRIIRETVGSLKPDIIIAVDLFALHCCQLLNVPCVFLSLEIPSSGHYKQALTHKKIERVIIQSEIRYSHLFNGSGQKPDYFLLPNAPVFTPPQTRTAPSAKLVYNGYIWSAFGPQFCLQLITCYPEYKLYMKGAVHPENLLSVYFPFLQQTDRLSVDTHYLNAEALAAYLHNCSIGFCFYNFEHPFIKENAFNYETGPSGKLFAYLSVGLPVICSNIQAFQMVKEANAGILIDDYSPATIHQAVQEITNNYTFYSDNALKLAEQNCFQKNIQPVINYLLQ